MGRVLLLTRKPERDENSFENSIYDRPYIQDIFKLPYRKNLAAKTVKESRLMRDFERECLIWLGLNELGITPLLKVVKIDGIIYALMPRYSHSLRDLLQLPTLDHEEIIKLFYEPIIGLANINSSKGLVHQDIKPENFLCAEDGKKINLFLSDWGIANLQANILSKNPLMSSKFTFQTMVGFGTIPYMAPERFLSYYSTISADIFSLGIVFFEILTGKLPYNTKEPIENQILSGEYYSAAKYILTGNSNNKFSNSILLMIHPIIEKRLDSYKDILKAINSL